MLRSGICRRNSICLSYVTFVHPTQHVQIFGNVSTPFCSLATTDLHAKFYGPRPRGTSSSRGVAKYSDLEHVEGYISDMVQDTALGTISD